MFTKFIKIETDLKDSDVNFNLTDSDRNRMINILSKFEYVEFKNEDDNNCVFCVAHINYIPQLLTFLSDISVEFTYTDLTKDILFGSLTTTRDLCFESEEEEIKFLNMIENFINDNLSVDIVLDKILEFGSESLTNRDILVLENLKKTTQ